MRGYFNFRLFSLFESILKVDPDFLRIIENIRDKDDPIAKFLYSLVSKDIKTNANYLKVSDKNDDLKFVNDTQVKRFIDAGQNPFERANNIAKIGRTVRQILTSNGISVADSQIEKFVNLYKNEWDKKYKKESEGLNLITGEDIRNWYLEDKYVPGGGTLNNSCMRYNETQSFLDIYTNNPEVCQLLILVDDSNRLLGRAILWKLVEGTGKTPYYLDRIYTRYDSDTAKFIEWFEDFIKISDRTKISAHYLGQTSGCRVQLKKWKFKQYPYMDTFSILDYESGILMTYEGQDSSRLQLHIQTTGGEPHVPNYNWSEKYQNWIRKSDSVWIEKLDDYVMKSDCVQDYNDNFILKDDSIYSEYYKAYLNKDNALELEGFGLVDSDDVIFVYDEFDGDKLGGKIKYLRSRLSKGDSIYVKIERGWSSYFVNRKLTSYDIKEGEYVLKTRDFNDKYKNLYKIDSSIREDVLKKLYFDDFGRINCHLYGYGLSNDHTKTPFIIERDDENSVESNFITPEVLESYGLEYSTEGYCISLENLYRTYRKMIYTLTIDTLSKQKINTAPIFSLLKDANEWLLSNFSDYKLNNYNYSEMVKYGSYTKFFNTIISDKLIESKIEALILDKDVCDKFTRYIREGQNSFSYLFDGKEIELNHRDSNLYDEAVTFLQRHKDQILFQTYWYILLIDEDYAQYKLRAKFEKLNSVTRTVIKYFCRYNELSSKYADSVNTIRSWFDENYDHNKLLVENSTNRSSEDVNEIDRVYNSFLEVYQERVRSTGKKIEERKNTSNLRSKFK